MARSAPRQSHTAAGSRHRRESDRKQVATVYVMISSRDGEWRTRVASLRRRQSYTSHRRQHDYSAAPCLRELPAGHNGYNVHVAMSPTSRENAIQQVAVYRFEITLTNGYSRQHTVTLSQDMIYLPVLLSFLPRCEVREIA